MNPPDVSVVVPVYNTMPYLRRCLTSLVEQSIGHDRMEIIAVDDGSTDGSDLELDRFARRFPDVIRVLHQPNSGGPAGPCNRALDVATGRYVFFVGADDYLGTEALQRLVDTADRLDSDVVLGKTVGVNSRFVYQEVFASNAVDIGLADSALPWSLANIKLFRRDLIEKWDLRYPEDMPLGSDLPFTLEACYRARRVSVVADYDCYYAVRRLNARNITYLSDAEDRLRCAHRLFDFTAELIDAGRERDAVLARLFALEVAVLLRDDLLRLDRETQQRVYAGVREIAERHLTDEIVPKVGVETRLRLAVVKHGDLDDLLAMIGHDAEHGPPPAVVEGDRWYAAYPGFRTTPPSMPDDAFDVSIHAADWAAKLDATHAAWGRRSDGSQVLTVRAHSPLPDLATRSSGPIRLLAEDLAIDARTVPAGTGTTVLAEFSVADTLASSAVTGQRRAMRAEATVNGRLGTAHVRASGLRLPRPLIRRRGSRWYAIMPTKDQSGHLMISVVPLTTRRILARLAKARQD